MVLRKKMASLVTRDPISTVRTLQTGLEDLQSVPSHELGGEVLHKQDKDLDGSFVPSEGTDIEKNDEHSHALPALEDVDEFESQAASVPNTSALETLVRTACESLAVSTLFSGNPSAQVNALNASDDQQTCKEGSPSGVDGNSESIDASSSCSHNVLDQVSAEDDAVFNAIFGNGRDSAVADGSTEEACNLSLQETPLDLTNENLSDIGDAGDAEGASEDLERRRASERERKRKPVRFQSPDEDQKSKKKRKRRLNPLLRVPRRDPNAPFKCDLCGSPYVINPTRRGNRPKLSTHHPSPRHKVDPETGKTLTLCNACGLSFDRPKKARKERLDPDPEEKRKYQEEASQFAMSLVEGLGDPDASRLSCPHFKFRACGCLQSYIVGDGTNAQESRERASDMLQLLKKAKELSSKKCYDTEEVRTQSKTSKRQESKNIGLGNGQRKSGEFEEFVLEKRKYLRNEVKLCERATQRVLLYSNNFLHKRLKTDPSKPLRIERQKGKAALGKLKLIEDLPKERCCVDNCVMVSVTSKFNEKGLNGDSNPDLCDASAVLYQLRYQANWELLPFGLIAQLVEIYIGIAEIGLTHSNLLKQWRDRAVSGQTEARRVLAEMLTPSGGARSNCYKFISWVTGCSHSTIGRVNEQMKATGGDREPPSHGLIKWWQQNPKPKKPKTKPISQNQVNTETVHQVALQQIQQTLPQVNILQAAVSSAGLSAVMMQPTASSGMAALSTVNSSQMAQTQLIPTVTLSNGTIQVQPAPIQIQTTQAIQVPQVQVQVHQQLQQQQLQYQQQIQQLQYQQIQLQQQQQQLQQQLQQTQQLQHQATQQLQAHAIVHQVQPVQQIQTSTTQPQQPTQAQQTSSQQQQQRQQNTQPETATPQQTTQQPECQDTEGNVTMTMATSNTLPTVTLQGNLTATQATPLNTESLFATDAFHILSAVQPQVVTLPVSPQSTVAQAVPVTLIQTSNGQQGL
ncbi:hypothetical protein P5673_027104 [Acropora cervicornis]|uniref:Uncharacterized protein n=1 Tax=Acropora cervicornis TaxID=6130 RepID=A0AAD9PZE3_ACRCE|nr:hypothetical protein P5673_027104 [Acropora cervicornis]